MFLSTRISTSGNFFEILNSPPLFSGKSKFYFFVQKIFSILLLIFAISAVGGNSPGENSSEGNHPGENFSGGGGGNYPQTTKKICNTTSMEK